MLRKIEDIKVQSQAKAEPEIPLKSIRRDIQK